MKKILSIFSVVLAATAFCPSCTNLESEMYNVINPPEILTTHFRWISLPCCRTTSFW